MSVDASSLSSEAQHLFEAAMKLSDDDREKLADCLFMSIEDDEDENAFEETIARRVAEVENGTARFAPLSLRDRLQGGARIGSCHSPRAYQSPQGLLAKATA